jgi:type I site-specific restriction-modification system R (restriction) subunit
MARKDYSEDVMIQAPAADLLAQQLGWDSVFAHHEEDFGPDSLLGRQDDTEVVLTREVLAALRRLNPGLPEDAYRDALAQVVRQDITKTLVQVNQEKYGLLRDGVPVKVGDAAGRLVDRRLRLLDLVENFILFDASEGNLHKIVARNHQYLGVNRVIERLTSDDPDIKAEVAAGQLGVFWHTQGSGKSYSMVFLTEKIHRKLSGRYSFVVITDRNELDDQIASTYTNTGRANSKTDQASSGDALRRKLRDQNRRYVFGLREKATAQAQVKAEILNHLFAHLPSDAYDADEISLKAGALFTHLYTSNLGGGARMYH